MEVYSFNANDKKMDAFVVKEIKKRKLAKFPVNATDDYKMKRGAPTFKFLSPTKRMIHVWLRQMSPSKGQPKGMMAFNYQFEDK
jgi:hypothetical protein